MTIIAVASVYSVLPDRCVCEALVWFGSQFASLSLCLFQHTTLLQSSDIAAWKRSSHVA